MKKWKRFSLIFCSLLALLLISWTFFLAIMQTDKGREWLYAELKAQIEKNTHATLDVEKVDFAFPLRMTLKGVSLAHEGEKKLAINQLKIFCSTHSLLQGKIVFSKIEADHLHVYNFPTPSDPPNVWNIPLLPYYLKIKNININRITFDPSLIDSFQCNPEIKILLKNLSYNAQGMIKNNPFRGSIISQMTLSTLNFPLILNIETFNNRLSIALNLETAVQDNLGFLGEKYADVSGSLNLFAYGPLSSWQKLIVCHLPMKSSPLEGNYQMTLKKGDSNETFLSYVKTNEMTIAGNFNIDPSKEVSINSLFQFGDAQIKAETHFYTQNKIKSYFSGRGTSSDFKEFPTFKIDGFFDIDGEISGDIFAPQMSLNIQSLQCTINDYLLEDVKTQLSLDCHKNEGSFSFAFVEQNNPWIGKSAFNLETAVQGDKVMQDFELGSLTIGGEHSQKVKAPPIVSDYGSKDCVDLSPSTAVSRLNLRQNLFNIQQLEVAGWNSKLEGSLSIDLQTFLWDGLIKAHCSDMAHFPKLLSSPIGGDAELEITAKREGDIQHISILGNASHIKSDILAMSAADFSFDLIQKFGQSSLYDLKGRIKGEDWKWEKGKLATFHCEFNHQIDIQKKSVANLLAQWGANDLVYSDANIEHIEGNLYLEDLFLSKRNECSFSAAGIDYFSMHIDELIGSSGFFNDHLQWPFELKWRGHLKTPFEFTMNGQWNYQTNHLKITTESLFGRWNKLSYDLKQPLEFLSTPNQIDLNGLWLQCGEGSLVGHFNKIQEKLSGQFEAKEIPASLLDFLIDHLAFKGKLDIQGNIEGDLHSPKSDILVILKDIQIEEELLAKKPSFNGEIAIKFDEGLDFHSQITTDGPNPFHIHGRIPIEYSLDKKEFKIDRSLPFHVEMRAEGELEPYVSFFQNDTRTLSGYGNIALNVDGPLDALHLGGSIDIKDASFEILSTGALYKNIQVHLEGKDTSLILKQFSAQDNKEGRITAQGNIKLDINDHFPFDFEIRPSKIFVLNSDYIDILASGKLNFIGNIKKSKLHGDLVVDHAIFRMEETLPNKVKTIDIQYINTDETHPHPSYFDKKETASFLDFQVNLEALEHVFIEGKNLKSEWKGNVILTGTPKNFNLNGELRIIHGEYQFNGKSFNLAQGNIHFAGPPDKKTSLYIVASKEIDRITAEMIVKGLVTKPVVSFRSNPPLSQREVLSYILFNRGVSDITQVQGDQLSQSFIALNNDQTASSNDFLSRLRNNIGVDLDLTTNDNGERKDIGLQIGKRLTENIVVTAANKSMNSYYPFFAVEARLRKNIKAQIEKEFGGEEDAQNLRMSIKWKKDY